MSRWNEQGIFRIDLGYQITHQKVGECVLWTMKFILQFWYINWSMSFTTWAAVMTLLTVWFQLFMVCTLQMLLVMETLLLLSCHHFMVSSDVGHASIVGELYLTSLSLVSWIGCRFGNDCLSIIILRKWVVLLGQYFVYFLSCIWRHVVELKNR